MDNTYGLNYTVYLCSGGTPDWPRESITTIIARNTVSYDRLVEDKENGAEKR